jgi:hypothetical protein
MRKIQRIKKDGLAMTWELDWRDWNLPDSHAEPTTPVATATRDGPENCIFTDPAMLYSPIQKASNSVFDEAFDVV